MIQWESAGANRHDVMESRIGDKELKGKGVGGVMASRVWWRNHLV